MDELTTEKNNASRILSKYIKVLYNNAGYAFTDEMYAEIFGVIESIISISVKESVKALDERIEHLEAQVKTLLSST